MRSRLRLMVLPALPLAIACACVWGCGREGPQTGGVAWPRFPVGAATRVAPVLAVIYSSDNIGPTASLSRLGYPDRMLFRLHRDHPQLHVALTSCPANRYSGERKLSDSAEATATWKALALDPNFDWVDLAGLGYNHAPPGDTHLDHHEFSVRQTGCNLDHRRLGEAEYCRRQMGLAREAYRAAGIPDDRVVTMRFPGMERSAQALKAAQEAGFLAVMDGGHDEEPGSEWWEPLPGGGEILEIRNANALKLFAIAKDLEDGLAAGRIDPSKASASPEFVSALARGMAFVQKVEATGGLLNLMDQWSETFREIGGARPRYLLVDALLRGIETRYGPRVWYPTSRELVAWLDARRHAKLSMQEESHGALVAIDPPESWTRRQTPGLDDASVLVTLPGGARQHLDDVRIKEGAGEWVRLDPARWWQEEDEVVVLFPMHGPVRLRLSLSRE